MKVVLVFQIIHFKVLLVCFPGLNMEEKSGSTVSGTLKTRKIPQRGQKGWKGRLHPGRKWLVPKQEPGYSQPPIPVEAFLSLYGFLPYVQPKEGWRLLFSLWMEPF